MTVQVLVQISAGLEFACSPHASVGFLHIPSIVQKCPSQVDLWLWIVLQVWVCVAVRVMDRWPVQNCLWRDGLHQPRWPPTQHKAGIEDERMDVLCLHKAENHLYCLHLLKDMFWSLNLKRHAELNANWISCNAGGPGESSRCVMKNGCEWIVKYKASADVPLFKLLFS